MSAIVLFFFWIWKSSFKRTHLPFSFKRKDMSLSRGSAWYPPKVSESNNGRFDKGILMVCPSAISKLANAGFLVRDRSSCRGMLYLISEYASLGQFLSMPKNWRPHSMLRSWNSKKNWWWKNNGNIQKTKGQDRSPFNGWHGSDGTNGVGGSLNLWGDREAVLFHRKRVCSLYADSAEPLHKLRL